MWFVYILKCSDNTFYTGITNNLTKRIKDHNTSKLGAKYTRSRRPVKLVYSAQFKTKSQALKKEAQIKKLTRAQKQNLINSTNLIKTFDKLSKTYRNRFTSDPVEQEKILSLIDSWDIKKGMKILEVGSGTGDLSLFLLKKLSKPSQLTCLDISPQMIKVSREKLKKYQGVNFIANDIQAIKFKNKFDRIIIFNTFPHFLDKKIAFQNCFNHLKKNGKLIICHNESRTTILTCHKKKIGVEDDISEFTENIKLFQILKSISFNIETFENNEGYDYYLVIASK